jgi:hypothetical protein
MDRRQMLRAMLGVAAASALPSEVWPFRKIFLPATPAVWTPIHGSWVDSPQNFIDLGYCSMIEFEIAYASPKKTRFQIQGPGRLYAAPCPIKPLAIPKDASSIG